MVHAAARARPRSASDWGTEPGVHAAPRTRRKQGRPPNEFQQSWAPRWAEPPSTAGIIAGAPVVFVVQNNAGCLSIRGGRRQQTSRRIGTEFSHPDGSPYGPAFAALAGPSGSGWGRAGYPNSRRWISRR